MKYLYKQTGTVVESGEKLDSTLFEPLNNVNKATKVAAKAPTTKTTRTTRTMKSVSKK